MKISKKILANAIRVLSMDMVQFANSGHPGAPMGMADIAEVLWRNHLKHNPRNPKWINRDRFVLSNGHASALIYSVLHLLGYNISIEDLKKFRKIHSKTPGHPEFKITDGIEITTGPLGQGIASAVGLAISEKILSAQFNRPRFNIIDHYTYVFLGDGCMMEGISHEACSIAGNMKLGKLIAFYDNNGISIDGEIKDWFNDDTASRFESYGWHVIHNVDGHDCKNIHTAIKNALNETNKPSLLICNTIIAFGSPNKSGSHLSHGAPLGEMEISQTRKKLKWNYAPFIIPSEIYKAWNTVDLGKNYELKWNKIFYEYTHKYPKLSQELIRRLKFKLPVCWKKQIKKIITNTQKENNHISTRQASKNILEKINYMLPELIGGSADLTPSTLTKLSCSISIQSNISGNYIHYGAREFGMTAIANGIAIYGGFLPYTATFLVFMEYAINAVRMASLMQAKHIMLYTHDSIGLGEDGPTHQPIEQLSALRIIPNLSVWRPCDQVETAVAWKNAIERCGPTVIVLTRQNVIKQDRNVSALNNISKGGYILRESKQKPELILISTGSEIEITVRAYKILSNNGYQIRVVSLPCIDLFESQSKIYKELVLPKNVQLRIAIEAGVSHFWYKYVGLSGKIIGIDEFGRSGSGKDVFNFFKINVDTIVHQSKILIKKSRK
ncbi:transketolase [Wigglesworthia glossinidia endosymbiont of Glossina morsitans morsitans (Yale colony)]|uniref:Transketolase n=1 Tax=Wigglesworthia glossinidia endosymbiont of Glossina morsitans morsitans (Yale colony) TaxID=1142511 RepID=H6Q4F3_WIGGL|nr:transketolase [Wigglesworthia glossinidia]AFA41013.1 transketolase [Wigglesworthia glossinidia endosymbiont of Glossina morsitans morsitans (Yale colony)]